MEASTCHHSGILFTIWSYWWHCASTMSISPWQSRTFYCEYESWVFSLENQRQALLSLINSTLTPQVFSLVVGITSFREIWNTLEQIFNSTSRDNILNLNLELQSLKKGIDTVNVFLHKIKIARDKLLAVGVVVDNEELHCIIHRGLPKEFADFCSAIRTRSDPIPYEKLYIMFRDRIRIWTWGGQSLKQFFLLFILWK